MLDGFFKCPFGIVIYRDILEKLLAIEMSDNKYVLITAARNEEVHIEGTIKSILAQTLRPIKWIIVSDGSKDGTDEIVNSYKAYNDVIHLIRVQGNEQRNFCSKVDAINAGYKEIGPIEYQFMGNLDADVSLRPDYYERIIEKFSKNPKLGIAGGIIIELDGHKPSSQNISLNSVAGAIQLFRRQCFLQTGGFIPMEFGGEDALLEIMARMSGWEVHTFPEIEAFHHRHTGRAAGNLLKAKFREGKMFYTLGYHPIFYMIRSLYRVIDKPYFLGSMFQIYGYLWSKIRKTERPIPKKVVEFLRREQTQRLKSTFIRSNGSNFIHTSVTLRQNR